MSAASHDLFPVSGARHGVLRRQYGASLIVSLLMLIAVLMLGMSAAQIALQGEKSARNDRDRQIAFQAAEAALLDAELDIENSPSASTSRSTLFSRESAIGFPADGEDLCGSGEGNRFLGLCRRSDDITMPTWLAIDFDSIGATTRSVPFGHFTGQYFQTGKGALPARVPRYIIELMTYNRHGEAADKSGYFYRITAIGYGAQDSTQVVLQSFYRKED
jgi:type IV pilus assembly protein PilX